MFLYWEGSHCSPNYGGLLFPHIKAKINCKSFQQRGADCAAAAVAALSADGGWVCI